MSERAARAVRDALIYARGARMPIFAVRTAMICCRHYARVIDDVTLSRRYAGFFRSAAAALAAAAALPLRCYYLLIGDTTSFFQPLLPTRDITLLAYLELPARYAAIVAAYFCLTISTIAFMPVRRDAFIRDARRREFAPAIDRARHERARASL